MSVLPTIRQKPLREAAVAGRGSVCALVLHDAEADGLAVDVGVAALAVDGLEAEDFGEEGEGRGRGCRRA